MPLEFTLFRMEERIIKSMLPPSPSPPSSEQPFSQLSDRRRRDFYQEVLSIVLLESSIVLFGIGYRKGDHPQFSLISCGLTYLVFWASIRYSGRTKFDLNQIRDRHLLIALLVALLSGLSILLLAFYLETLLLALVAMGTVFSFFLIAFILVLARSTQNLFRSEPPLPTMGEDAARMPVFRLLVYMAFFFIAIHNGLYFAQRLTAKRAFHVHIDLPILSPALDLICSLSELNNN